jgi:hypothetical protein
MQDPESDGTVSDNPDQKSSAQMLDHFVVICLCEGTRRMMMSYEGRQDERMQGKPTYDWVEILYPIGGGCTLMTKGISGISCSVVTSCPPPPLVAVINSYATISPNTNDGVIAPLCKSLFHRHMDKKNTSITM